MKRVIFVNRKGIKITLDLVNDTTIEMDTTEAVHNSYAQDNDGNYMLIDPDGGPSIKVGDDMGIVASMYKDLIVTEILPIEYRKKVFSLTVKKQQNEGI